MGVTMKKTIIILLIMTWVIMLLAIAGCSGEIKLPFGGNSPSAKQITDPVKEVARSIGNWSWLSLLAVFGGIFAIASGNLKIGTSVMGTGLMMLIVCSVSAVALNYLWIGLVLVVILAIVSVIYALKTPGGINIKKLFGWESVDGL